MVWRHALALLACCGIIAVGGCGLIKAQPPPVNVTGTLQGVITGPAGPVANAEVTVTASDATQHASLSNGDGYYSIAGLPVGAASISVRATGYAQFDGVVNIAADPGGTRQDVSLNPQ